jgi:glycosyltransferase involved in cell wall biosynthesis
MSSELENQIKKKFKIFFNHTTNAGVSYYRMISSAKYMRSMPNVDVAYSAYRPDQECPKWEQWFEFPASEADRDSIINQFDMLMGISDISVWQMLHYKSGLSLFMAYRKKYPDKKILMEADDYLFGINPESLASISYYPNSDFEYIAEMQLRNASGVIVSTDYLKKEYEYFNKHIQVVPNGLDFEIWDKLKKSGQKSKTIRIGWAGGQAHALDLKVIHEIIPEIKRKYKNVEFVIFGGLPDYFDKSLITHISKWYNMDEYPQALADARFDIGLAPLRDNKFNRCKSNLRWLEYSALSIPTVASPIEPFLNMENCILAKEPKDYIDALSVLIENKNERISLGTSAYKECKKDFNVKSIAKKYLEILKDFHSGEIPCNTAFYEENAAGKVFSLV